MNLLLKNIGLLATPTGNSAKFGKDQGEILKLKNCCIQIENDLISYIGEFDENLKADKIIDCENSLVTPGLIDAHTHLVFGGWRQNELVSKIKGASYLEILENGGGILDTVQKTRLASEEELIKKSEDLLKETLLRGTTTCECKSGYGLDLETEIKQLEVIKKLNEIQEVDLVSTFMGAHAVPKEFKNKRSEYVNFICDIVLPKVSEKNLAEFCDVFCESGAFDKQETKIILQKAKDLGLKLKAHVDEIEAGGGAELAASFSCVSAEHLIMASDAGIKELSKNKVVACLLPSTSLYLDKPFARARFMIDNNVPVAIATDFNPGSSPSFNLQLSMNLACLKYKMTPEEVLTAVTLNAAAAIDRCDLIGSLEVGKKADIVIWNSLDLEYIFYRFGSNLVKKVIKNGLEIN